jgi:Na+/H+-dicarboxylate symporter
MKIRKPGLLPQIIIAIVLGILLGMVLPAPAVRIFATFNSIFAAFLFFCIPLIILGMVAPGIADLGKNAGRMLAVTTLIAYGSTVFSGFFTYTSCRTVFPYLIDAEAAAASVDNPENSLLSAFFNIDIPPVFDVMTALVIAFILGIGIAVSKGETLKLALTEFKSIVERVISAIIIPLLPVYIFGIFLNMSRSGAAFTVIVVFGRIIGVIFVLHILLLLIQYSIAGAVAKRNPFRMLYRMLPAYMTALGTSSSAATIPVTLAQVKKNGISEDIADFCVPLCATIHLAGSAMKITAMSLAICILTGRPYDLGLFSGFIMVLSIMMVAAPGVPGGAIMAAIGVLQSMLGFDQTAIGLITALYIAIDSFGTACNVTGDGAIAVVMDQIASRFAFRVSRSSEGNENN